MAGLLVGEHSDVATEAAPESIAPSRNRWLVFRYSPVALFALKMSRATSTAGKTLLIPTPYSAKMAFVDAALRHRLTETPHQLVRGLADAHLRIGVPHDACVTGTIQSVRQETRDDDRRRDPKLPPYRPNIALREFVYHQGPLRLAFDTQSCAAETVALLVGTAPAINYFGKRGSFMQYLDRSWERDLDSDFTRPVDGTDTLSSSGAHRTFLDDFGPEASFAALNSFLPTEIRRGLHRVFVDTWIPLVLHNAGPGFLHYRATG
jgi:hypothetical protein